MNSAHVATVPLTWLTIFCFFPVTSTTRITDGQSVSAMHVLLSVLFYESSWMGTRMSFRWVVDSASVASFLVKVSFCEVVGSASQASFREVVDSACGRTYSGCMNSAHVATVPQAWLTIFYFFPGDFHDKDYRWPVGECHACPVVCSVL